MNTIPKEWLEFLREQFPEGSQIKIKETAEPHPPFALGEQGKLEQIDNNGCFHVRMSGGTLLTLVLGEDRFSVSPAAPTMMKLYMPLTADLYTRNKYGEMEEDSTLLDGRSLRAYEGEILRALINSRMPEESESGIMHWYGKDDNVNQKVKSAVFTVEDRNGQLWGVAECRVVGTLTPEELTTLKEYISGQASDGWGEGFEQRDICAGDDELYVHLWQWDNWSIQTEQERFAPKVAEGLPEQCFSTLATTGQLICIKRGESGYSPSEWDTGDRERNVELVDELNEKLGVTPSQRQAMEIGSLAGWDAPGADPKAYEPDVLQLGGM